jgi:hypothetical protein
MGSRGRRSMRQGSGRPPRSGRHIRHTRPMIPLHNVWTSLWICGWTGDESGDDLLTQCGTRTRSTRTPAERTGRPHLSTHAENASDLGFCRLSPVSTDAKMMTELLVSQDQPRTIHGPGPCGRRPVRVRSARHPHRMPRPQAGSAFTAGAFSHALWRAVRGAR